MIYYLLGFNPSSVHMLIIHKFFYMYISNDISQLHVRLQADLVTANSWFCSNGLMVNPEKNVLPCGWVGAGICSASL